MVAHARAPFDGLVPSCRRVELVLLHAPESEPKGTIHWLKARPHLARHHHARLSHAKVSTHSLRVDTTLRHNCIVSWA